MSGAQLDQKMSAERYGAENVAAGAESFTTLGDHAVHRSPLITRTRLQRAVPF
jgi:hypothetical protein